MLGYLQGLQESGAGAGDGPGLEPEQLSSHLYSEFFEEQLKAEKENNGQCANDKPKSLLLDSFEAEASNQVEAPLATDKDVWIFGYGSLVWKADFPYIDRRRGFVWGFKRRFYQHSIDHRGIPERPGRVVTLLPGDPGQDRVYGVAYRIAASQKAAVLDHLDYREKNGYERCSLEFHEYSRVATATNSSGPSLPESKPIQVIMYVATQANDSYAGNVWEVASIAKQIFSSAGPSGPNREYLFNLATAMDQLFPGAVDEHLEELVANVKRYITEDEPHLLRQAVLQEIASILREKDLTEQTKAHKLEELLKRCQQPGGREWLLHGALQQRSEA
ncbi:hypothetical protein KR200_011768 [Drosophila serrata]|nr:hypothetical protein KR200_011768 [Drosophila serrata]